MNNQFLRANEDAFVDGLPPLQGIIRGTADDFIVDEELSFELEHSGQHVYLKIRKRELNTEQIVNQLARLAGVKKVAVGYAGLKDKRAVASQWFSIDLCGRDEPDWSRLDSSRLKVLEVTRHRAKLRRGAIKGNTFSIKIDAVSGDRAMLELRLQKIAADGVPNYFGEQRFGFDNLGKAAAMFNGEAVRRHQRGIYLSAVRSMLFNRVLSSRVSTGLWNVPVNGDVMMLDGSHSIFCIEEIDDTLIRRTAEFDIHPTGPLWGQGELMTSADARALEESVLQDYRCWCQGLESAGLKQQRRQLRVRASDLSWYYPADDSLCLQFSLPSGSYATAVLRELVDYTTGQILA